MSATPPRSRLRTARAVFGVWTLYGAIVMSQAVWNRPDDMPAPWKPYGPFLFWMGRAWLWAAVTPLIALLVRRLRPSLARPHTLLAHAAACAVMHGALTFLDAQTRYFITAERTPSLLAEYPYGLAQTLLLYVTTAIAVLGLDHARLARERAAHAARLEADLARSRLDTLRRQLQPHFLFNTLNTIAELVDTDPARAGTMITQLGDLLRRSLDEHEEPLIELRRELEFVRLYTQIEQVRFESWLRVVEEVEPEALDARVPPMLLQPLVENAIRHGISPAARAGTIWLRARRQGERLLLEVADDGVGIGAAVRDGLGLRATRERLAHLYGGDAQLALTANGHTRAALDLPFDAAAAT